MTEGKLIFIGTAGDTSAVGKQLRASGGIILQFNDSQFHLDPGPGSLIRAIQYGVNIRNNTAILVSNNSIEKCNDLNAVIHAMTLGGLDKKGVLISTSTVIKGSDDITPYLTKFHSQCLEKTLILDKGKMVGVEDIDILAIPTSNDFKGAIGYKFVSPKCSICYTGDTKFHPDLINHYKDSDILILNVESPDKSAHFLSSEDAAKIIEKAKPKLAILTNFGLELLKADPIYEARIIQRKTGVQTIAAKDGMIINTNSFAAKVRQSTLNSYKPQLSKSNISVEVKEISEFTE